MHIPQPIYQWAKLLRWDKPSGRLILLIPAGWSLWLTPNSPPQLSLIALIAIGGIAVSGAGCIANDLWDRRFDRKVIRTMNRPLATESIQVSTAWILLVVMLFFSFLVVLNLPVQSRNLCIGLAFAALPLILLYPSAKRWCPYPQALLAVCWGFSVLIPWGANQGNLNGGWPLLCCWGATLMWTFGFDTVYAMADSTDDAKLGLNSSVLSLKKNVHRIVSLSYLMTCLLIGIGAIAVEVSFLFWPTWILSSIGMQRELLLIRKSNKQRVNYGKHFKNQVWLGALLLLGLILGRLG